MHGWYAYDSQVNELDVEGKLLANRKLALNEYPMVHENEFQSDSHGDKPTGHFTAIITSDRHSISGTWQSADGTRRFPFTLTAVAVYRTITKRIVNPELEKSPAYAETITEAYPEFLHPTPLLAILNQRYHERAVKNCAAPQHGEEYVSICYVGNTFVSLGITVVDHGGHDFYYQSSENYLLTGKKLHTITLDDLIINSASIRQKLLLHIRNQAIVQAGDEQINDKIALYDIPFTLSPAGITYEYPRDFGIRGSYDVAIPFVKLKDMLLHPHNPLQEVNRYAAEAPKIYKDAVTGLTVEQAVMLGMDAYCQLYNQKTNDDSTDGMCNQYQAYTDLIMRKNDRLLAQLPSEHRKLANGIHASLVDFAVAKNQYDEAKAGGGTIYRVGFAVIGATLADLLTKVCLSLQHPEKDSLSRTKADNLLSESEKALNGLKLAKLPNKQYLKDGQKALVDMHKSLPVIKTMCSQLPDKAALLVAAYTMNEMTEGRDE